MNSKTKVSKEVAAFIEGAKEFYSFQDEWKKTLIEDHTEAINDYWADIKDEALVMKQYSTEQLKDILDNGYTVE